LHRLLRECYERVVGRGEDGERSSVGEGVAETGGIDGGEQVWNVPASLAVSTMLCGMSAPFLSG
jgi:hypothetical protein